jgi:hypothetical protein
MPPFPTSEISIYNNSKVKTFFFNSFMLIRFQRCQPDCAGLIGDRLHEPSSTNAGKHQLRWQREVPITKYSQCHFLHYIAPCHWSYSSAIFQWIHSSLQQSDRTPPGESIRISSTCWKQHIHNHIIARKGEIKHPGPSITCSFDIFSRSKGISVFLHRRAKK